MTVLIVAGCATTDSMRPTQEESPIGLPEDYAYPRLTVFEAAQQAARELGLQIVEENAHDTYFLAKRGLTFWSWGNVIGVYVLDPTDTITPVLVLSQPVFPANLHARDYAIALHTGLRHILTTQNRPRMP
jgi:hypothetical protein